MTHEQLATMLAVTKRYPYAKLLYSYAESLALNGRLNEARTIFLKIRRIHGERLYGILREDIQERAAAREPKLLALSQSLPD
jgi:hypothetical protein